MYKLNLFEIGYLNAYSKKIKHTLTFRFCIEIFIELYIGIFRKLSAKQQHDKKLNLRLMDYCMAIIQKKYYLSSDFDDSIYKETLPDDIYRCVKDKEQFVRMLNDSEERELLHRDKKRMTRVYHNLIINFDKNHPEIFYEQLCKLASCCEKSRIVPLRSLFYDAHSFMVDHDSAVSLKLYLRYLNVKSSSNTFKYKSITKNHAAKLFINETQKKKFDTIHNQFRQDYDLEKALGGIDELFIRVRRKINLHIESIKEAKAMHNEVAQMLGQYLDNDEPVNEKQPLVIETDDTSEHKKDLFDLFISHSFRLNRREVNIFVESRGLFRDALIERINDDYYEMFDDLLIEEDGEYYILNEDYYKQLND